MSQAEIKEPIIHAHIAVIETKDSATLTALYKDSILRPFLWHRLDSRRVVVGEFELHAIRTRISALGLTSHASVQLNPSS
ncbi:MAG: hypothetical protein KC561_05200 [Myxococcales bacterium]|nr:hypothetical protein [Myxococcales bacterium]